MAKTEIAMIRNEALIVAYRQAGYSGVWRSAPGCCRICTGMNGQTATTLKPPLHKECGCDERSVDQRFGQGLKNEDQIVIMDVKKTCQSSVQQKRQSKSQMELARFKVLP